MVTFAACWVLYGLTLALVWALYRALGGESDIDLNGTLLAFLAAPVERALSRVLPPLAAALLVDLFCLILGWPWVVGALISQAVSGEDDGA